MNEVSNEQTVFLVSYCRRCGKSIARNRFGTGEWWAPGDGSLSCPSPAGKDDSKCHVPYSTTRKESVEKAKAELRDIFLETS